MNFKNKLKTLITSPQISADALTKLKDMDIEVMFSCENKNVLPDLRYHTDMQITNIGCGRIVCAPECYNYYSDLLRGRNIHILAGDTVLTSNYPGDIAYNIIVAEKLAIHNFKYTDPVVLSQIGERCRINVSQGYTACSLCMLNETAFITSDRGIYSTLVKNGKEVLLIDDSHIRLDGFDHGFLGGASVMLSENMLAVNGCLDTHPDCDRIREFCSCFDIEVISLSSDVITDIGSFISC